VEPLNARDVAEAVRAEDAAEAEYRASGTVALSAIRPRPEAEAEETPRRTAPLPDGSPPPPPPAPKRRRLIPSGVLVVLVLLAMVLAGFWLATRLPIDLPLGIELYSRYQGSGVTLQAVPAARRASFTDHKLRSKDDAENLVIQLERGQLDS
jgi:protein phosphatase